MKKYFLLLKYTLRHKWFVMLECFKYGLYWRGIVHDLSKFHPREFIPYANKFYGEWQDGKVPPQVEQDFEIACNHHYNRNDHHWQYWVMHRSDGEVALLDMPDKCRKEMVADWRGIARDKKTVGARAWYYLNEEKIALHPATEQWVKRELNLITLVMAA